MSSHKKKSEIICRCNEIEKKQIAEALQNGAKTLNEIFDLTTAGVGACGGSCRGKLQHMLETYQSSGEIPEKVIDLWAPIKK